MTEHTPNKVSTASPPEAFVTSVRVTKRLWKNFQSEIKKAEPDISQQEALDQAILMWIARATGVPVPYSGETKQSGGIVNFKKHYKLNLAELPEGHIALVEIFIEMLKAPKEILTSGAINFVQDWEKKHVVKKTDREGDGDKGKPRDKRSTG
jgi:hypothetical protein